MALFIKICGITSVEDARAAQAAGADAIGLNFYPPSPRYVSPDTAATIAQALDTRIKRVGIFVNADVETIEAARAGLGLDYVQLHGDESPEQCARWGKAAIKALCVRHAADLARLQKYSSCDIVLLDAAAPGLYGGTGRCADWSLAAQAVRSGMSVLLAGGLTPENVAEAIALVQPFGVDVAGGVEAAPGRKDHDKVRAFIAAARAAADQIRN